ncbi:DUF3710 domain-containing protein [Psychromicrobium lacuslunae]|uniref:DUF3710 domain-containing protein n=1 Tax=Psychromicrobium lacuslunae TaxID=1618207 RepID=A0A0D4BXC3_9MICC|nr:DUF3710 domain-containing protein [Psychromicrobium lacuslunae]AJT40775.1 hypothetical protein UM93_03215 [Psychromicrobium lacuslunae]
MVFGRGKRSKSQSSSDTDELTANAENQTAEDAAESAEDEAGAEQSEVEQSAERVVDPLDEIYDRQAHGPFDEDEVEEPEGYLNLGALLIKSHPGLQLRLEVEESTQRVIAVTLDLDGSSLQLQGFAAPRSEQLWPEIREQIGDSVESQGGNVEELDGTFGPEVLAKLPAEAADGSKGYRVARFIGVDGPRWFLRGVLGGPAALEIEAASDLEALFRSVIVVRGDSPMPPRDLLPLVLPKDAVAEPGNGPAKPAPGLSAPERGPEITEIG